MFGSVREAKESRMTPRFLAWATERWNCTLLQRERQGKNRLVAGVVGAGEAQNSGANVFSLRWPLGRLRAGGRWATQAEMRVGLLTRIWEPSKYKRSLKPPDRMRFSVLLKPQPGTLQPLRTGRRSTFSKTE